MKSKKRTKALSGLLALMMLLSLVPMSVFATEWSGHVNGFQLQAGDILTSDVAHVMGLEGYTLTLEGGGHGDHWEVKNSDTVSNEVDFDNQENTPVVFDMNEHEIYFPYNENGMVDYWVVVAVDHDERTITLSGKGAAADGEPVALGYQVDYVYYDTADSFMHNGTTPGGAYKVDEGNVKWADGSWYVLTGNVTFAKKVKIDGTVNLVLCDGATLTANQGIEVNAGATLNIYAQSGGTGAIDAKTLNNYGNAAIGGTNNNSNGTITIHGGNINATSESAAAIGGGMGGDTGVISIYGGNVYARNQGGFAAGIGCGYAGNYKEKNYTAEINILGGTVTGWSSEADGIGKSDYSDSAPGTITIKDGAKVYAGGNADSAVETTASGYLSNRTRYVRIEAGVVPVATPTTVEITAKDAYVDNDGLGYLRFVSTVNVAAGNTVEYFGTWFIPENLLTDTTKEKATVKSYNTIENGKSFTADLLGIPHEALNRVIAGVSFVKVSGQDEVSTDVATATVEALKNDTSAE